MKPAEIKNSIDHKRVYLNKGELLEHWVNGVVLTGWIGMLFSYDIQSGLSDGIFPLSLFLVSGLLAVMIWHKIRSRKFEIWDLKASEKQFKDAALATAIYLEWRPVNKRKNFLKAIKGLGWQWDGVRITAIRTETKVYFNSMIEPSIRSNPFSFGWNAKNKRAFRGQLIKAMNGENVVEQAESFQREQEARFLNSSELSGTHLLKRIVLYLLIVFWTGLGVLLVIEGANLACLLSVIAALSVCAYYLYADLKILNKKRKKTG
ncbi:MAG: hypothetical protein H6575_11350 [Lewinellaceae bacterium]|nr:hypothetical protein [Lewinellaceae bacterium]